MHRYIAGITVIPSSLLISLMFLGLAMAQPQEVQLLTIDPNTTGTRPLWTVISSDDQSMRLEMRLPTLSVQEINVAGEIWQKLTIDHGGLAGQEGTPALPTVSHLIAVPAGVLVNAHIIDYDLHEINDLRLMPQQSGDEESFHFNETAYSEAGFHHFKPSANHSTLPAVPLHKDGSSYSPAVHIATPAIMAGQAVLPITIGAVSYDPVARTAMVTSKVIIEINFSSEKSGRGLVTPIGNRQTKGTAFKSVMQNRLLGNVGGQQKQMNGIILGTWAVVCRDTTVKRHLEPLIQWRARQGYHVEVVLAAGNPLDIKDQLQSIYNDPSLPPLEFILLAGDAYGADNSITIPTFMEFLSFYRGEGDHYYSTLDGDDILADAHVGRLSFDDLAMLDMIVAKVTNYEQHPFMDNTEWFRKACVIGDTSASGPSTIYVNQWLKGQFLDHNYTAVDTIWGGNFVGQMMASVNQGISAFGYRGFGGMSGISSPHIMALGNHQQLPVAILPTCDTGSFDTEYTCRSEAWLKAPNGGAIAAIGTATGGTHTRYNNCFYQGIWDGLLNAGDSRIGVAHTLGKMEIYNNYFLAEPDIAEIWAVWNNIMGDGASPIWQGVPQILSVDHLYEVSVGSNALSVTVESDGLPVANALVCLYRPGELSITAQTDASGTVLLVTPTLTEGTIQVTVTGRDLLPYLGQLQVGSLDNYCGLAGYQIDDDNSGTSNGNGNGRFNPGETIELSLAVMNQGTSAASQIVATIDDGDIWISSNSGSIEFANIPPGGTIWSQQSAVFTIDNAAPDGAVITVPVLISDGQNSWTSVLQETVYSADLSVVGIDWSSGATFEPGQSGQLVLVIQNEGHINAEAARIEISTRSPWLTFTNNTAVVGDIRMSNQASNASSPFQMEINPLCHPGHLAVLDLTITHNNGMQTTTDCTITIGTAEAHDPTGPDTYGYYAFDNTDAASFHAPVFDWVALDPGHGGVGTSMEMQDFAMGEDETQTIDLPFTFRYYGTDFAQVSICSNGWMAMGETPLVHYRNYIIPGKGSPGSMIAPFWDNLIQGENGQVYYFYDEAGHRFIVQWYMLHNEFSGAPQNFEVILLDPAWHPTPTGDGSLIFQYETVNNNDSRNGYATVGIQNHGRTNGLLYSYWNQYSPGSAQLESGRAIRFHPLGEIHLPVPGISSDEFTPILGINESSQFDLQLSNSGPQGSFLDFTVKTLDPATIPDASLKDIQGSTMTFSTDQYDPGTTVEVDMAVSVVSEGRGIFRVSLLMPQGVTLHSAEDLTYEAQQQGMPWNGENGEAVNATWGYSSPYGSLGDGMTFHSMLELSFAAEMTGDVVFNFRFDEVAGSFDPDVVTGSITLTNGNPSIRIQTPATNTIAILGQTTTMAFEILNASNAVDIALQRNPNGPWETLATSVDASPGTWPWLVSGEPGPYAVIRISDSNDESLFRESAAFVVSRNMDWINTSQIMGSVGSGQSSEIGISIDATNLGVGSHSAVVIITTSTGESFSVPVNLTVDAFIFNGTSLPQTVALMGNYPNPFNPSTTFAFTLPREMAANLDIYSMRGMMVRRLLDGTHSEGVHQVVWDGTDNHGRPVPSGVYFCRLITPEKVVTEKLVLAK